MEGIYSLKKKMKQYKRVLTIAGSDSCGGAGIQADIKTISACGCYAMSAITAITAQNTAEVRAIHNVPADMVAAQIAAVLEDVGVDAVKLGMLPTAECVKAIAELLLQFNVPNVVLDPVVVSTSGCRLIDEAALEAIRQHLFPLATVITPNIPETTCLTGVQIHSEQDFDQAASVIHGQKVQAVLFKAGHLDSNVLTDYLYDDKQFIDRYQYHRINTPNTHGTGCTLSSAIASYLALGYPLKEAIRQAEEFLHGAIVAGSDFQTGHGHGPVHHFYRWW